MCNMALAKPHNEFKIIGEDFYQRKPIQQLDRWEAILSTTKKLPDKDFFVSIKETEIIDVSDDFFWLKCPYYEPVSGSISNITKKTPIEAAWKEQEKAFPIILEAINSIKNTIPVKELPDALCFDDIFILPITHADLDYVKEVIEIKGEKVPDIPDPSKEQFVSSHGDPLLKNLIRSSKGYILIDWEGFSPQKKSTDLAHSFEYILMRTDPGQWKKRMQPFLRSCSVEADMSEDDSLLALAWWNIRSAAFWQGIGTHKAKNSYFKIKRALDGAENLLS